jgi:hypothetical protein
VPVLAAAAVLLFLMFFLWTFGLAEVVVCAGAEFWAFLAALGAAIKKGTAATVSRVEVNSFFIVFLLQLVAVFLI